MSELAGLSQETGGLRAALVRLGRRMWAVPAAQVLKVLPHQMIQPSPGLAASVLGVVAYAGEVLPVLDLRAMLDVESGPEASGELLLVEIAGEKYTVPVDQVVQILSADTDEIWWRGERVSLIDLSDLLAQTLSARVAVATNPVQNAEATGATAAGEVPLLPALHEIRAATAASLVVDTEHSRERLPLYSVVELCETLPVVAIPDPNRLFNRAAFYRDALIPVLSLDALLGQASGERQGAFVVVDLSGRRCALTVARVVGMSNDPAAIVDLRSLLTEHLPESPSGSGAPVSTRSQSVAVDQENRYLIVETAGRVCGFALDTVAHIHSAGRIAPTPPLSRARKIDVTAIGGRVLPVLHLAQELDLEETGRPQHFIEFKTSDEEAFVVAVDRVRGVSAIERKSLLAPPQGSKISAIVKNGPEAPMIWIVEPASLAMAAEGSSHAA